MIIKNFLPNPIIINIAPLRKPGTLVRHAEIRHYLANPKSLIIPANSSEFTSDIQPDSNLYISTDNAKYMGHADLQHVQFGNLLFVGKSKSGFPDVPSGADINIGLGRVINISNPSIMFFNPYYNLLILIILIFVMAVSIYIIILQFTP
jgi:hypothetical protein